MLFFQHFLFFLLINWILFDIIIIEFMKIEKIYLTYNKAGGILMITKDMSITDIVSRYPQTVDVFRKYGMSCFG